MTITIQSVIDTFQDWVMSSKVISPDLWMDGALKLNVLLGNEYDLIAELEQRCAIIEGEQLAQGFTSARAKTELKKKPEWLNLQKQKGKIRQVEEFIRLAKKHAQIVSDQMRNSL